LYRRYFKRIFDLIVATLAFLIHLPLFLVLMVLLVIDFRGKVFFIQERPGKNEQVIRIIKFKSMNDKTDENGNLLPNYLRTTLLGRFLRKTSLDELPQLINVIRGDISLVGPRPLLFKYLPLYNEEQRRRHDILPGITGWAQVNGRNAISWQQKFEFDVYYVDHYSFPLDLKILLLTVKKVFASEGVNTSEEVTMPPFDGTN
jgi:undecaprenyl phosphate N,N'-diacetylbacillosamine 1-phosphate transferase